ncbi:MAG TPA: hypothetical protein VMY35_12005, partial [Phycisphaerae bacterium]|nr:hypothetical protein [Phycisphaerae bacterium]
MTTGTPYTIDPPPLVEIKAEWSGAWQPVPELFAETVDLTCSPDVPSARLSWRYGSVNDGSGLFRTLSPLGENVLGSFVRVRRIRQAEEAAEEGADAPLLKTLFTGVITAETHAVGGSETDVATGGQQYLARGLEHLLARSAVDGSFMLNNDETPAVVAIDRALPFNLRAADGKSVAGNRSAGRYDVDGTAIAADDTTTAGSYVFGDDGEVWTGDQIAEYLLVRFGPTEPGFALTGATANLAMLESILPAPANVHEGLSMLANHRRGHAWRVTITAETDDDGNPTETVAVEMLSLLSEPVAAGSKSLEPATAIFRLPTTDEKVSALRIASGEETRYDRIVVRGEPLVLAGSFSFTAETLEASWNESTETAYRNESDEDMLSEEYAEVYTTFRVPTGKLPGGPTVGDDGQIDLAGEAASWQLGKSFMRQLPWRLD